MKADTLIQQNYGDQIGLFSKDDLMKMMIEFAKLHGQKIINNIKENVILIQTYNVDDPKHYIEKIKFDTDRDFYIQEESITNTAYLNKIK